MIKTAVKTAVALTAVTGAFMATHPTYETNLTKEIDCYQGKCEQVVTVSWDLVGRDDYNVFVGDYNEKHFSIERFVDGDINDAFVISMVHHNWENEFEWNVWNIEFFKDVDDFWFNIQIGK